MVNPFQVGEPVDDPRRLYGRGRELEMILNAGPEARRAMLFLGLRRSGKTSLLRAAGRRAQEDGRLWPVEVDLQGLDAQDAERTIVRRILGDVREWRQGQDMFADVDASEDRAESLAIEQAIGELARSAKRRDARMLLLVDEAEALVDVARQGGNLLPRMRAALLASGGPRTVLAGSRHVLSLLAWSADGPSTSVFLSGFEPFRYLRGLGQGDAEALIEQAGERLRLRPEERQDLRRRCGGHPYLLQGLCHHLFEAVAEGAGGDVDAAEEAVRLELGTLAFGDDLRRMSRDERKLLQKLLSEDTVSRAQLVPAERRLLDWLSLVGLLERANNLARFGCAMYRRWLLDNRDRLDDAEEQVQDAVLEVADRGGWIDTTRAAAPMRCKVFISSTWKDLDQHREKVCRAIDVMRHQGEAVEWIGMEGFPATTTTTAETCKRFVDQCHIYVGALGVRYGSRVPGEVVSFTELEYRRARERRLPCLAFLLDENAHVRAADVETDAEAVARLQALKAEVRRDLDPRSFTSPDDLASQVQNALLPLLRQAQDSSAGHSRPRTPAPGRR